MASENTALTVILGTGGTIAGQSSRAGDNVGYVAGQVSIGDLVAAVPVLTGLALEAEQVDQIDSKDVHFGLWRRLIARLVHHLARPDVSGVVITHGTDTLEETAYFVHAVLKPVKPVVFTSAMRPASALVPDGPQNLQDAVVVARDPLASGVLAVCAGKVHAATQVAKVHSYRVDAFDSGDAGPLACVEEGAVRWYCREAPDSMATDAQLLERVLRADRLPRVELVTSHADTDGALVRSLLSAGATDQSVLPKGIVVAGTGNGTLHSELAKALLEAMSRGVRVVRATRCAGGRVIPDGVNPIPDSAGLSPVKARIALALSLLRD